MEKTENKKYRFGLIGKNIDYSFSRGYFTEKFKRLKLENYTYENFDLHDISELEQVLNQEQPISGLNITIPYKQEIFPFLDKIDKTAFQIGAVNTIKVTKSYRIGFNTDAIGFQKSIEPHLRTHHKKALILGTGGASRAVNHVLHELGITVQFVSRKPELNQIDYADLTKSIIEEHELIINCTPLGTHPEIKKLPNIRYDYLGEKHLLFDLIYNPEKTAFLAAGENQGASIANGQKMLEIQAEASWHIWNMPTPTELLDL